MDCVRKAESDGFVRVGAALDHATVTVALTDPWWNGQTEGLNAIL